MTHPYHDVPVEVRRLAAELSVAAQALSKAVSGPWTTAEAARRASLSARRVRILARELRPRIDQITEAAR